MKNGGSVITLSFEASQKVYPGYNIMGTAKAALENCVKQLANEYGKYNIRVNALNPVAGETPLLKKFMGEDTPEIRAKFLSTIPLGRFSTPEDMGNAAVFLCSEKANMITGVALEVDGGRCI